MSATMVENGVYSDYRSPLATRYVSKEMRYNFSDQHKFSTWRKLWIYLAKAEMYEERGTCNADGEVEIKTVSLIPAKPTKSIGRSKQSKIMDKRSLTTTSHAIKAVSESVQNNPDRSRSSNLCTLEQCQLSNLACPNDLLMAFRNERRAKQNGVQAWNVNGNLGNTLDQSLLYDNLKKNYVQHQQSMILPSISAFLKKRKGPRSFKLNEAQRYSNGASASGAGLINNHCSCQCGSNNSIPENMNVDWNSVQNLMSRVSRVLFIPNGHERQILLANNVDCAPEIAASQPLAYPDRSFANHFQYGNYCDNYSVIGQNDATAVHLPDQISAHAYDVRAAAMLEPSREHLPQQLQPDNVNWIVPGQNNDWYCSNSILDQLTETRNFPEYLNGIYYQTNGSQNAQEVTYSDQEIGRGSILNRTASNFDDPYACAPAKSQMFGNDGIFCENKQSIGDYIQGEEKFAMRPILKFTNADVKINY